MHYELCTFQSVIASVAYGVMWTHCAPLSFNTEESCTLVFLAPVAQQTDGALAEFIGVSSVVLILRSHQERAFRVIHLQDTA